jgi:hypothetical protein
VFLCALAAPLKAGAALADAGTAATDVTIERGVVQDVSSSSVTLKELDGTFVVFPIAPDAKVLLNSHPALLLMIRPSFVVALSHQAKQSIFLVRAWGTAPHSDWGIVQSLVGGVLVIDLDAVGSGDGHSLVAIRVDTQLTKVRKGNKPLALTAIYSGMLVRVTHPTEPTAPATRVDIFGHTMPQTG